MRRAFSARAIAVVDGTVRPFCRRNIAASKRAVVGRELLQTQSTFQLFRVSSPVCSPRNYSSTPSSPLPSLRTLDETSMETWQTSFSETVRALENGYQKDLPRSDLISHLLQLRHSAEALAELVEDSNADMISAEMIVAVIRALADVCQASVAINANHSRVTRGLPQRAQHVLEWWAPKSEPTRRDVPIEAWNELLRAWANSCEHLRGTFAEQIFRDIPNPNGETYRQIVRAWCWSKEKRCAFTATSHFLRHLRHLESMRANEYLPHPTIQDYHILFDTWAKSNSRNSASQVHALLQMMEKVFEDGCIDIRPDERCFRDALIAMSTRTKTPEIGDYVDDVLARMKVRGIIPDSESYGAAILSWNNVAHCADVADKEVCARRAVELLQEMTHAFHRTTRIVVRPSTQNYNHVLGALLTITSPKETRKACTTGEMLLKTMESSDPTLPTHIQPDAESYRLVLDLMGKAKVTDKIARAEAVLQNFIDRFETIQERDSKVSDDDLVGPFNSFISVCASVTLSSAEGDQEGLRLFKKALNQIQTMLGLKLKANSKTYHALLNACGSLVSDKMGRSQYLESIFRSCRTEGYVDQDVLKQLQTASSTHLYTKLVVAEATQSEGKKIVPTSWTRRASVQRVGRKPTPLSIEGNYTFSRAAAEYKMRNLRRRRNQKILRGGRM